MKNPIIFPESAEKFIFFPESKETYFEILSYKMFSS